MSDMTFAECIRSCGMRGLDLVACIHHMLGLH